MHSCGWSGKPAGGAFTAQLKGISLAFPSLCFPSLPFAYLMHLTFPPLTL